MTTSKRTIIVAVAAIFIIGLLYANYQRQVAHENFLSAIKSQVDSFDVNTVDYCGLLMLQQNQMYALCTTRPASGANFTGLIIVLRDTKLNCPLQISNVKNCNITNYNTVFNQGDYLGLQVNLQKLNTFYQTYYACTQSDLPIYETSYPLAYGNVSTSGTIQNGQFSCSPLLNESDFQRATLSAFLLDRSGNYTIMKVWLFDGSLGNIDFANNLDKGKLVLDLGGGIK